MKTAPKQKPPNTTCSYHWSGLAPAEWKIKAMTMPPAKTLSMVFQLAMFVQIKMIAPIAMAITDVSPTEPGINPTTISLNDVFMAVP